MSRVLQIGLVGRSASLPLNTTHMIVECHAQVQRDVDPVAYKCSYRFEALKWELNCLSKGAYACSKPFAPLISSAKSPNYLQKEW